MTDKDEPEIRYLHMGAWPCYVGFTTSEEAFAKEMKRLNIDNVSFMGSPNAGGTAHYLQDNKGTLTIIVTIKKHSRRTKEQVAGLIAHEALHVIQEMEDHFYCGKNERFDRETESYLVQYLTQEFLAEYYAPKSGRRATEPTGADA